MTRRSLALIALPVTLAALVACSPATVTSTEVQPPRTVSVSATGEAEAVPDAAKASLTIEVTDPSSAA